MPTPRENVIATCPRLGHESSNSAQSLLRIRRNQIAGRDSDLHGPEQSLARELECAIPDTKPEEHTGILTPPPSEPESDSGDSSWTRTEQLPRAAVREKSEEKNQEEEILRSDGAHTPLSERQTADVVQNTDVGLVESMSSASISPSPRYLHYSESQRDRVSHCAEMLVL
ncbi:uncharacterized protein K489DRAFT_109932 [Dissoconium aciculare CBS 342.82]|jgi:hypothetical protein|uniref:Uncharacterized protein n=1 Tax=Dissoconium aciculare CBS 342.82 TaxID=1314786 RepID=A0A6J3MDY8_9PEZI|nr:uncharacterized protein K489DRAFT_109932 [Dissoconium aciculare CBS 342.82]KAF1826225.1 hypothetical protein K489DRAFT_109932 [Dissoconium aciculare CBS 342.82]